jgi:hypothetical protein
MFLANVAMNNLHDIERVIRGVRAEFPTVEVVQTPNTQPADDDGLWWFRLPTVSRDIQLESSTYNCPFWVEHSDMVSSSEAFISESVIEAVMAIVSYLRSISTTV